MEKTLGFIVAIEQKESVMNTVQECKSMGKSQRPHFAVGVNGKAGDFGEAASVRAKLAQASSPRQVTARKLPEGETAQKPRRFAPGSFTMVVRKLCRARCGLRLAASIVLGLGLVLGVILVVAACGEPELAAVVGEAVRASSAVYWMNEPVDSFGGWAGEYASLAVDGFGGAHVSYVKYNAGTTQIYSLKHAWLSGTVWYDEFVEFGGKVGLRNSLALDPVSPYTPHVSYLDLGTGVANLRYAWRTSSGWLSETIDTNVGYCSLAVEPAPPYTVHMVYWNITQEALLHAWLSGTTWYTEVVESRSGYVATYISLALEPVSPYTPHISYQDGSSGFYDLKHAWWTPSGWLSETVESEGNVGTYSSLALELASPYTPHISYYESTGGVQDLRHAWWTPSGWLSETVDATGDVGEYSSLALEPVSPYTPHIAYFDDTNDDLRHAWWTSSGWLTWPSLISA